MTSHESADRFDSLLDRVAEDEARRFGNIEPIELPEDHLLPRPKTIDMSQHRGTRLYRVGKSIASALDTLFDLPERSVQK